MSFVTRYMPFAIVLVAFVTQGRDVHAEPGDVQINEILYHTDPDNTGGEFLELFNSGETVVDLTGWTISDAIVFVFPDGTTIDPGGFLVVAREPEEAKSFYGVDVIGPYEGRLNNAGDNIVIKDAGEAEIDVVVYDDDSPWPSEADGGGPSLELVDPASDNNLGSSWAVGQPFTPGAQNAPVDPESGDVVISEIMYKPLRTEARRKFDRVNQGPYTEQGDDEYGEFVEIYNRGEETVDLSGWAFTEGIKYQFPDGTALEAGAYFVVAAAPDFLMGRQGIENVGGPFNLSLRNGGERVTLRDQDGNLMDTLRYNDKFPWPTSPDEFGASLELISPLDDNSTAANWRTSEAEFFTAIILGEFNEEDAGWQFVEVVGTARNSRLILYVDGPGEWLVDEVEVRPVDGGDNVLENGHFNENDEGWSKRGRHRDSFWTNEDARAGGGCEHLVSTGSGSTSANVGITMRGIPTPSPHRITFWAKYLTGTQTLKLKVVGLQTEVSVSPARILYDLAGDWSDEKNPDGPWEYRDGDDDRIGLLRENWMAGDLGAGQKAWSTGDDSIPGWCRSTGNAPEADFPAGRVGTHGPSRVTWDAPGLGQVTISGGTYLLRHAGGDQRWELSLNDKVISGGELISGAMEVNSGNPSPFSSGAGGGEALTFQVSAGDVVALDIRAKADQGNDFVGVDLEIDFRSGKHPDPPFGGAIGFGTPGLANSIMSDRLPPFVEDLQHFPDQPTGEDMVTVSARVSGSTEIAKVELERIHLIARNSVPLETVEMFDDGAHNDGEAGDGLYAVQVEPERALSMVLYWVRAEDSEGLVTQFPYDSEPSPTQGYFHYNNEINSGITVFHLFMSQKDLQRLADNPRDDTYLNANLVIDDRRPGKESGPVAYPNIGARRRGRGSRLLPNHQFKFKFNRANLYDNNRVLDTMLNIPLLQRLGFVAFDVAGIDNLESEVVRLYLNGRFWHPYVVFEVPNSTWASKHGYGGGTEAYKARSVETTSESKNSDLYHNKLETDLDFWGAWNKKMRSLEPPSHIRELTNAVNDLTEAQLLPWVDANIDLRQVLVRYEFNILFNIDDFAGHNFYLFRPEGGKWKMLGYDYDSLGRGATLPLNYTDGTTGSPGWQRNKFFMRVNRNPTLRRIHHLTMQDALLNLATSAKITPAFTAEMQRARGTPELSNAIQRATAQLSSQRRNMARFLTRGRQLPGADHVPTIDPPGGEYGEPITVTLTAAEGFLAVYTLDGTDPRLSTSKMVYRDPIGIAQPTVTLRVAGLQDDDPEDPSFNRGLWTDLGEAQYELDVEAPVFLRGDFNLDGSVTTTDVVQLLFHLFRSRQAKCRVAGDANNDNALNISDAIYVVDYLFGRGSPPSAPFPNAGVDPEGVQPLGCTEGLTNE